MKRLIVALAMAASLVLAACAQKPTVDTVVEKQVKTLGGAEKLAAIQDQVTTWDGKSVFPQGDSMMTMNGETVITYKRPNKIKFEIKGPDGATIMASAIDGSTGWMMMGGQVRDMSQAEFQENVSVAETFIDGWHNYANKGIKLALLADTTVNGKTYHVIQATDKFNNVSKNFCDPQTGLVERMESEGTEPMSGQKQPFVMTFADHAAYDGFMMPKKVASYDAKGNLTFESNLKDLKNNASVADEAFAKPMPVAPASDGNPVPNN